MEQAKVQEKSGIEDLKAGINDLIVEYQQAYDLLNEQMQAVINNDVPSLNTLLQRQVETYEVLKESELKFKNRLQAFHQHADNSEMVTLSSVIKGIDGPVNKLNELRSRLHADVEKTEKMRLQLVDLIQFAQQQNEQVFKAICRVAENNSEAYDAAGNKQHQRSNGIAINQQA